MKYYAGKNLHVKMICRLSGRVQRTRSVTPRPDASAGIGPLNGTACRRLYTCISWPR